MNQSLKAEEDEEKDEQEVEVKEEIYISYSYIKDLLKNKLVFSEEGN
jgi:hypothetical protein